MSGAKGNRGEQIERLAGHQAQPIALGDRGQNENPLHHRKMIAYADARAIAEGKIGTARQSPSQIAVPALGTKDLRILVPSRIAMDEILHEEELGAARHPVPSDLAVLKRFPGDAPDWRIEPQRLAENPLAIGQP